ncbi:hypothetical protein AVEN_232525-1 [Araneus ventricosus]|uniref:Uncharacterized protein n=1 Tax=Araneus ventricosus TaxID=182803 RepID=A0A4Y2EJI9_ARAVE|nr:hypothetical protein AVEN_232525-1 [Araneus ventricosus]
MRRSPDLNLLTLLELPPMPCKPFSIANGDNLYLSLTISYLIKNRAICDTLTMLMSRCCSVGSFTKEPMKKDKVSGPDGTAHHGAQQGKAVAGSRHPQPQHLPCMLAKT